MVTFTHVIYVCKTKLHESGEFVTEIPTFTRFFYRTLVISKPRDFLNFNYFVTFVSFFILELDTCGIKLLI
jgi:hypothetical protein